MKIKESTPILLAWAFGLSGQTKLDVILYLFILLSTENCQYYESYLTNTGNKVE